VCSDQEAVDLVRDVYEPSTAAKLLVDHALARFSTDNLSCMVVRFDKTSLMETQKEKALGVEGDTAEMGGKVSEADRLVNTTKQKIADGETPAVGVSASNSGRGHDLEPLGESEPFKPTSLGGPVEEEPHSLDDEDDAPEVTPDAIPDPKSLHSPTTVDGEEAKDASK
jgi:protein phosphatase PTC1